MKVVTERLVEGLKAAEVVTMETVGLVRDFLGKRFLLLGYAVVEGDRGNRIILITVASDTGDVFNLCTKSENLLKRVDDLIDMMEDDGMFGEKFVKFGETKTKAGNTCLTVSMVASFRPKIFRAVEPVREQRDMEFESFKEQDIDDQTIPFA